MQAQNHSDPQGNYLFEEPLFDKHSLNRSSQVVFDDELSQEDIDELYKQIAEALETLQTIGDFVRFCVSKLRHYEVEIGQGTTDAFAEAAALVLHTLSLDWQLTPEIMPCRLTASEKQEILTLLSERIIERKPLSYLINLAYFCDMPFYVDERVLIPRSPIAELIKKGFYPFFDVYGLPKPNFDNGLPERLMASPERILDLCTGSGCIAIALASRFVDASVDATDIDKEALEVAAVNVDFHEIGNQVSLIESDLFDKLLADNQYDLIVTNPPYVDAKVMADLPPEFLYEPELALAAGQDGLDLVHRILYFASDYLTPDGLLICEVGDSEWALRQAYPNIQFDWLKFERGGSGVFAMDYDELMEYKEAFAKYL